MILSQHRDGPHGGHAKQLWAPIQPPQAPALWEMASKTTAPLWRLRLLYFTVQEVPAFVTTTLPHTHGRCAWRALSLPLQTCPTPSRWATSQRHSGSSSLRQSRSLPLSTASCPWVYA
jgi:hypothetical protein